MIHKKPAPNLGFYMNPIVLTRDALAAHSLSGRDFFARRLAELNEVYTFETAAQALDAKDFGEQS